MVLKSRPAPRSADPAAPPGRGRRGQRLPGLRADTGYGSYRTQHKEWEEVSSLVGAVLARGPGATDVVDQVVAETVAA